MGGGEGGGLLGWLIIVFAAYRNKISAETGMVVIIYIT